MTLAARLIGLAFILLGLFLLVSQADAEGHRLGLAAVLFGGSIWLVDFGLSAMATTWRAAGPIEPAQACQPLDPVVSGWV